MSLQLDNLEQAINTLERAINTAKRMEIWDDDVQDTVRAGVIQNFEVAYEQCWKMMRRWLVENVGKAYVDNVNTRRGLFRLAAESHLITDVERWMDYHSGRNETSHTYDEDTAQSVFEDAIEFANDAKQLFSTLEAHND